MKKAFLFDSDGVLIHATPFSIKYAQEKGLDPSIAKSFFVGPFQECLIGKQDVKEILPQLLAVLQYGGTVEQYMQEWFTGENLPDRQMIGFVKQLKQQEIKCYLTTNQEHHRGKFMQEVMFPGLFDAAFVSADVGAKKPDAPYYEHVAAEAKRLHGFVKEELFYIDDAEENVASAQLCGIDAYYYTGFDDFYTYFQKHILINKR